MEIAPTMFVAVPADSQLSGLPGGEVASGAAPGVVFASLFGQALAATGIPTPSAEPLLAAEAEGTSPEPGEEMTVPVDQTAEFRAMVIMQQFSNVMAPPIAAERPKEVDGDGKNAASDIMPVPVGDVVQAPVLQPRAMTQGDELPTPPVTLGERSLSDKPLHGLSLGTEEPGAKAPSLHTHAGQKVQADPVPKQEEPEQHPVSQNAVELVRVNKAEAASLAATEQAPPAESTRSAKEQALTMMAAQPAREHFLGGMSRQSAKEQALTMMAAQPAREHFLGEMSTPSANVQSVTMMAAQPAREQFLDRTDTQSVGEQPAGMMTTPPPVGHSVSMTDGRPAEGQPTKDVTIQAGERQPADMAAVPPTGRQPAAMEAVKPAEKQPAGMVAFQPVEEQPAGMVAVQPAGEQPVGKRGVHPAGQQSPAIAAGVPQEAAAPVASRPVRSTRHEEVQLPSEGADTTAVDSTPDAVAAVSRKLNPEEQPSTDQHQDRQAQPEKEKQPASPASPLLSPEGVKVAEPHRTPLSAPAEVAHPARPEHEHIISQVKEKLIVHDVAPGKTQISFTLNPEELGEIKIMLRMDDQRLKVDVIAQNLTVKEVLMSNLDGLRDSLSRQNITVDRFDVSTGSGTFNEAFQQGGHAHRNRPGQMYPHFAPRAADQEQKTVVSWQPRENSLVDVRL